MCVLVVETAAAITVVQRRLRGIATQLRANHDAERDFEHINGLQLCQKTPAC